MLITYNQILSHKTQKAATQYIMVWGSVVTHILADTKFQQKNIKNLGCSSNETQRGGGVKKKDRPEKWSGVGWLGWGLWGSLGLTTFRAENN